MWELCGKLLAAGCTPGFPTPILHFSHVFHIEHDCRTRTFSHHTLTLYSLLPVVQDADTTAECVAKVSAGAAAGRSVVDFGHNSQLTPFSLLLLLLLLFCPCRWMRPPPLLHRTHSKQRVMLPGYKKKQRVCDPCHKSMSQPAPPTRKSSVRTSSSTAATDHTSDAVSVPPSLPVQRRSPGGDAPAAAAALPPSGSSTRAARVMSASVDRADAARPPPPQRRSSVMVKVTVSPDSPSMFEGRCLIEHGAVGGSTPARLMLYATEDYGVF